MMEKMYKVISMPIKALGTGELHYGELMAFAEALEWIRCELNTYPDRYCEIRAAFHVQQI